MERTARERKGKRSGQPTAGAGDQNQAERIRKLEDELKRISEGDYLGWRSADCPPDIVERDLEDIVAFESVGSGPSLFEGLQQHGLDLPAPEKLDDRQITPKVIEVGMALFRLQIMLVGFQHLSPREFYSKLWNETLWEACYVQKRNPAAFTIIDVSHNMSKTEIMEFVKELEKTARVQ
jgi:hypothetical protein